MRGGIDIASSSTANLLWNFIDRRPNNPNFEIVFRGLMAFCYNPATQECEVAFHRDDPDHKFRIEVREKNHPEPPVYALQNISRDVRIELGIDAKANDVGFYYQNSKDDFDRINGHPHDFRWLLDFESERHGYNIRLGKMRDQFTSKLYLRHGTFYTHQLTNSTFIALGVNHPLVFTNRLPKYIISEVRVENNERLYLTIDGTDVLHDLLDPNKSYEIHFLNDCIRAGSRCTDSDFHRNFDFVDLPAYRRFTLVTVSPGRDDPPPAIYPSDQRMASTDSAPCMGAGFGQSPGFPPEN
jgi:hypothetical protein